MYKLSASSATLRAITGGVLTLLHISHKAESQPTGGTPKSSPPPPPSVVTSKGDNSGTFAVALAPALVAWGT